MPHNQCCLHAGSDSQLLEDRRDIMLDRLLADAEVRSDLLVTKPKRYLGKNSPLAACEHHKRVRLQLDRGGVGGREQPGSQSRGDVTLSTMNQTYAPGQFGAADSLEHEAPRARLH